MATETPEQPGVSIRFSESQSSFLAGLLVTAVLFILLLLGTMLGFLVYGLFSGSNIALVGSAFCLAGSIVLMGILAMTAKIAGIQKERVTATLSAGREAYTKAQEQLHTRYEDAQQDKKDKGLETYRETYRKAKEDLSARYNRAKHGEY
jgi:hypothetical protein